MMLHLAHLIATRIKREEGQGMIEYALIASLISIAALGFLSWVGFDVTEVFDTVENALGGSDKTAPTPPTS